MFVFKQTQDKTFEN